MRLIDADALIKEYEEIDKALADFCEMERMMCREVIRALQNAPTIEPIEDTKSCGVSADKSAEKNVADVPSGDVNKMQTPAEQNIANGEVSVSDMAGDLISREEAKERIRDKFKSLEDRLEINSVLNEVPSAEPKGANLINRHDATTVISEECWKCNRTINDDLFMRIMSLPTSQQTDCTDFIMWLIEVVLDEEDWELNAVSYGEIIARELKKLGLLEVKDGYYIRPSADRPKGEWIQTEGDSRYMCSVCKVHQDYVPTCMGYPTIWNYCPSCGADMRGGERTKGDNE